MKVFIVFVFFVLLVPNLCNGLSLQNVTNDSSPDTIILAARDTLNFVLSNSKADNGNFDWQANMPWIGAIIIGLLSVLANIIISKQSRISNERSLKCQLDHAKEVALAQLESSRQNMQLDFNKTVLSGNRQIWIKDLRELMSKLLTKVSMVGSEKNLTNAVFEEVVYLITKVELMLNAKNDMNFIIALKELEICWINVQANITEFSELTPFITKVKNLTHETLKTEWERVKKGE